MSVPFQRVIAFYWKNETFSLLWQTQTRVLNILPQNFHPSALHQKSPAPISGRSPPSPALRPQICPSPPPTDIPHFPADLLPFPEPTANLPIFTIGPSSPHFRRIYPIFRQISSLFRRRSAISASLHRWPSSPLPSPTELSIFGADRSQLVSKVSIFTSCFYLSLTYCPCYC
jgi:hypothetical protein